MAIAYDAFLPEILPYARNCPDPTIEAAVRHTVIEICAKTEIWQQELDPVSAIAEQYAYDLEPPANSVVHRIIHVLDSQGEPLTPVSSGMLEHRATDWRNNPGTAKFYVVQDEDNQIWLAPAPSASLANAFLIRAVLKPSMTSSSCTNYIMSNYRDCIVNGAIARLLQMPDRDWSNYKTAAVKYAMYQAGIVDIEKRARKTHEGVVPVVEYGGIGGRVGPRRRYDIFRTRSS